ncbi:hypothetical protein F4801DRAFT_53139 [Xylaria longipes]|nr:hypothetical protein F4801DRAFT_53139 [Xylaria longipes]
MLRISFLHNFRTAIAIPTRQPLIKSVSHSIKAHTTSNSSSTRHQDRALVSSNQEGDVYVVTLKTDPAHQKRMSELRAQYFPPHLLKVNAHITLFHALPDSLKSTITSDLLSLCAAIRPFGIRAVKPFRIARGVGFSVSGLGPAEALFAQLQKRWWEYLTPQDRRKFRGHYTLMNKVDDRETVERCLKELASDFEGCGGLATGLDLWRYDRGWWRHEGDFEVSGASI